MRARALLQLAQLLIEIRGELRVEPAELTRTLKRSTRFNVAVVRAQLDAQSHLPQRITGCDTGRSIVALGRLFVSRDARQCIREHGLILGAVLAILERALQSG